MPSIGKMSLQHWQHCSWAVPSKCAACCLLLPQIPDDIKSIEAAVGHITQLRGWVRKASEQLTAQLVDEVNTVIITHLLTSEWAGLCARELKGPTGALVGVLPVAAHPCMAHPRRLPRCHT